MILLPTKAEARVDGSFKTTPKTIMVYEKSDDTLINPSELLKVIDGMFEDHEQFGIQLIKLDGSKEYLLPRGARFTGATLESDGTLRIVYIDATTVNRMNNGWNY
ncbi:MAG: hypothetical protein LBM27_05665 [Lactobacillaceae bacterium]|jgi:hypothetical protein|nr:hypothetical protein [Lactobacillaceae bacterium]